MNKRTDNYGGSLENRVRLLGEVLDELIEVWGADRVGVKLAPNSRYNDMLTSDPLELLGAALDVLNAKNVAFVEVSESFTFDESNAKLHEEFWARQEKDSLRSTFKNKFKGAWITNFQQTQASGNAAIEKGETDLVSFGALYIANSDLPEKFASEEDLNGVQYIKDPSKMWSHYFYGSGPEGYTDLSVYSPKQ